MIDAAETLHGIYANLSNAWSVWAADKSIGDNSPAVQWVEDDPPHKTVAARELLLKGIEFSVAETALAVHDHLDALTSVYPPEAVRTISPENSPWPGTSTFTLTRSILEGAALISWLVDGSSDHEERARRSARHILWSAHHGTRWANATGVTYEHISTPEYWKHIIEEAGFAVTATRGQLVVDKVFQHTEVITTAFGDYGKHLYNRWSGAAHHAPWVLTPGMYFRPDDDGGGLYIGMSPRLAEHVQTAADVSELLLKSSSAMRIYWGRSGLAPHYEEIQKEAQQLKAEAAQIRDQATGDEPS